MARMAPWIEWGSCHKAGIRRNRWSCKLLISLSTPCLIGQKLSWTSPLVHPSKLAQFWRKNWLGSPKRWPFINISVVCLYDSNCAQGVESSRSDSKSLVVWELPYAKCLVNSTSLISSRNSAGQANMPVTWCYSTLTTDPRFLDTRYLKT